MTISAKARLHWLCETFGGPKVDEALAKFKQARHADDVMRFHLIDEVQTAARELANFVGTDDVYLTTCLALAITEIQDEKSQ